VSEGKIGGVHALEKAEDKETKRSE